MGSNDTDTAHGAEGKAEMNADELRLAQMGESMSLSAFQLSLW